MPPATTAKPAVPSLAAKADELGALLAERETILAPFKFKQKRLDELSKEFRDLCPAAPDQPWRVSGARYDILLSIRAFWRAVDVPKLSKIMRPAMFAKIATVTLAALEASCEPDVIAAVVTQAHTGPRTLTMIEKAASGKAEKKAA